MEITQNAEVTKHKLGGRHVFTFKICVSHKVAVWQLFLAEVGKKKTDSWTDFQDTRKVTQQQLWCLGDLFWVFLFWFGFWFYLFVCLFSLMYIPKTT